MDLEPGTPEHKGREIVKMHLEAVLSCFDASLGRHLKEESKGKAAIELVEYKLRNVVPETWAQLLYSVAGDRGRNAEWPAWEDASSGAQQLYRSYGFAIREEIKRRTVSIEDP